MGPAWLSAPSLESPRFTPVNHPAFHYERHLFQSTDVLGRISLDSDDIAEIAGLYVADLGFPTQNLRSVQRSALNGGQRRHSILHHQNKFARLCSMRKRTDIRSHGELDSGRELFAKFSGVVFKRAAPGRSLLRCRGMLGKVVRDSERRNRENAPLAHKPDGFVAELIGMIDGNDAGLSRVQSSR